MDLTITEDKIKEIVKEKLPKWFAEQLESDYSNPLKDCIKEEFVNQEGIIKVFVRGILSDVMTDPEFKAEMTKQIIGKVIEKGLSNR